MKMPPSFQFYPSDFLSDENVALMTNQEVGCYIKLICYCWKQGSIPSDINKIARLCGEDGSAMAQLWHSLKLCFQSCDDDTRLIHQRLVKEREKQVKFRAERSESGKRGAALRWDKQDNGSAIKQPMAKNSSSSSISSSSSSSTTDIKDKDIKPLFVEDSKEILLSRFLYEKMLLNNPKAKTPKFQTWAKTIDLMIRVDKRSEQDIKAVISWCQKDNFWKANILSAEKLRKQFDQLLIKSKQQNMPMLPGDRIQQQNLAAAKAFLER